MGEYPSDCPEPRRVDYMMQHTGGQYVAKSQQFCGTPDIKQLGEEVSSAVWNGIFGGEIQQY